VVFIGKAFVGPGYSPLQSFHNFTIVEDMRKREHLGQLELMVLFAVIQPSKESYGVQISREIAEKSGREVALASVYAALERLEKKGLVTSSLGTPSTERGGKARTYFQPTAAGLAEARDMHKTLQRLATGLAAFKA
jgi:PadR family transcriptional regulator, regulatory protein PadR